jgi:aldehyde:ferredoxin oxidoreductase
VIAGGVYYAVIGTPLSAEEFMTVGERVWNLQKAANLREGFDRKDDKFPERWVKEPLKWGEKEIYLQDYAKTRRIDEKEAEVMLDDHYDERGWDVERGIPTKEKLAQLGLQDIAQDLEKRGLL